MKCFSCGADMITTTEDYDYTECGLGNVVLGGAEVRRCPQCGEKEVVIAAMGPLHGFIAKGLVEKTGRLAPEEIRFLRRHLGLSGTDLASHMGVTPETISRWENGAQEMGTVADKLLRLMVATQGPVQGYLLEALRTVATGDADPLRLKIPAPPAQALRVHSARSFSLATSTGSDSSVEPAQTTDVASYRWQTVAHDGLAKVA